MSRDKSPARLIARINRDMAKLESELASMRKTISELESLQPVCSCCELQSPKIKFNECKFCSGQVCSDCSVKCLKCLDVVCISCSERCSGRLIDTKEDCPTLLCVNCSIDSVCVGCGRFVCARNVHRKLGIDTCRECPRKLCTGCMKIHSNEGHKQHRWGKRHPVSEKTNKRRL